MPDQLRTAGFPQVRLLARGMEGEVYALDEQTVAKVYRQAPGPDEAFTAVLTQVASAGLPYGTTTPLGSVFLGGGGRAFLERRFHGRLLDACYDVDAGLVDDRVPTALVSVLGPLAEVRPALATTTVLGGLVVDYIQQSWSQALGGVLTTRLTTYGGQLRSRVPGLDGLVAGVGGMLRARTGEPASIQHGDICGANVLVDADCRPVALIDWGFLTLLAEPAFDAALAAAFLDMYGPHAVETDRRLRAVFADAFGFPSELLLTYQALYALIGSNAYSDDGRDGHFEWCVRTLNRADVRAATSTWA